MQQRLLYLVLLLGQASTAKAHDTWVQTNTNVIRVGDSVHVDLMLGNHGIMIFAPTVAYAFDEMYYFERSAETLVTAYMTGKPLRVASHDVAEKTARQWREYPGVGDLHFAELRNILDAEGSEWRA